MPSIVEEVVKLRAEFVDRYVTQMVSKVDDFSDEQLDEWENQALVSFRENYPALNGLLPTHY